MIQIIAALIFANPSLANICDRTEQVKITLENQLNKKCDDISEAELATVEKLDFTGKEFSTLKLGDFNGLVNLKRMTMDQTLIQEIPVGIFKDLKSLEMLSLTRNHFATLHRNQFEGLSSVRSLQIVDNPAFSTIEPGAFAGLNALLRLNLAYNSIQEFPSNLFDDVPTLNSLITFRNKGKNFPVGILKRLTDLRLLTSDQAFPEANCLEGLTKLEKIFATFLAVDSNTFNDLRSLRIANLTLVQENIPDYLFRGSALTTDINLTFVTASELPKNLLFGSKYFSSIELRGNNLRSLPDFHNYKYLSWIKIDGSKQLMINDQFKGLTNLGSLYLFDVTFKKLTREFLAGVPNLSGLTLSRTDLEEVEPLAFTAAPKITSLGFGDSPMKTLPSKLFAPLTQLKELALTDGGLVTIPPDVFDAANFSANAVLYIGRNPLDAATVDLLKSQLGSRVDFE